MRRTILKKTDTRQSELAGRTLLRAALRRKLAGILIVSQLLTLGSPAAAYAAGSAESTAPNTIDSLANLYREPEAAAQTENQGQGDLSFVNVDESLYINLDHYGAIEKANVVKGFSSSKQLHYTDYGNYKSVLNMSTEQKLKTATGSVSFDLDGNGKKFFVEGKLDPNSIELPWNISLGYKLNGVPVEAEALRGASGTVEIDIQANPNKKASEYMRNNMILAVVIPVDDQKIYSVDAPGSQTQTIGEMTGVMFTALPGEQKDFTARLGTDSYESIGVVLMMIPATMDSLDSITDIKYLKDTWKDSGDAIYDGMDDMLGIVEGLRGEMEALRGSLGLADDVRGQLYQAKDSIFNTNDRALSDLNQLGMELEKLIPFLASSQEKLWQLNSDVNDIVGMLDGMQSSLSYLSRGLSKLADGSFDTKADVGSFADELRDLISDFKGLTATASDAAGYDREKLEQKAQQIIDAIDGVLAGLPTQTAYDRSALANGADWYADDDHAAGAAAADADAVAGNDPATDQAARFARAYGIPEDAVSADDLEVMGQALDAVTGGTGLSEKLYNTLVGIREQMVAIKSLPAGVEDAGKQLDAVLGEADALSGSAEELLGGAGRTGTGGHLVVEDLQDTIAKVQQLNSTVNSMYPDVQSSLTQLQAVLRQSGTALNTSSNALWLLQNTLRSVADTADASLRQGIQTSLSMIDKTLSMIEATGKIRKAGTEAKDTLDAELDKYDGENNVLKLDPNAVKPSFTSAQNKEPASLQIILRTDEIEAPEDDSIVDGEKPAADESIFTRIKNIFVKIFRAIVDAFQNA